MKRFVQLDFLKISHFTVAVWEHPEHNHNHFELVFIRRGSGVHVLNGVEHPYSGRTLFLLGPSDYHFFRIEAETEFTFLKFTNIYLNSMSAPEGAQGWNQCIDGLLVNAGRSDVTILGSDHDKEQMDRLVAVIVNEWTENRKMPNDTIFFLIQAIMSVVKRRLCGLLTPGVAPPADERVASLVNYIHAHINSVERVQAEHLSEVFGCSKNYLGIFFKEHLGMTLRDYVSRYKLSLIENRLKNSSFTIKEISYALGFTDLSHFNKFFQKHKGIAPKEFRLKMRQEAVS